MRTILKPMLEKVRNKYSECLAVFKGASNIKPKPKEGFSACRFQPCYTGAVITRAIQLYFDCKLVNKQRDVKTIAILESGSVRSYFPFGNITLGQVMKILPWQNTYSLLHLKGHTIKIILERSMGVYLKGKHGVTTSGAFLQLSGGSHVILLYMYIFIKIESTYPITKYDFLLIVYLILQPNSMC